MNGTEQPQQTPEQQSPTGRLIRFCITNRLVVMLFVMAAVITGLLVAPFDWHLGGITRYPVPVDAIPDIGENQQIVFTRWMGRSPQDVEDQIGYPLTVQLLGIPGVKTIRSYSMFGFSTIYIIFKENAEFYWSRTRVLEKLNSLPAGTLPPGVQPTLGPDATALGQIYWYTLEGRDPHGNPTGGWDPDELRTLQDWYARYWLLAADGVAEVASVGGYVKEFQIDVDPDAMLTYGVTLNDISRAVKASNIDVGARTLELNSAEYFIRGVGFIKRISDLENSVVKINPQHTPVLLKHVAHITTGPAERRGALDKGGAPVVGGVVVARYGDNPLRVISNVKKKIEETREALPVKVVVDHTQINTTNLIAYAQQHGFEAYNETGLNQDAWKQHLSSLPENRWPTGVTLSKLTIVPFYDRTGLIYETLGTLNSAITQEILITIIVVLIMVRNMRSSVMISSMLPLAVLLCFAAMKFFGVQANIVALSGIAIAIGTIVDMGIVVSENILRNLNRADPQEPRSEVIHRAASEVGGAVLTAVLTTVISFLPVFTMIGAEGKLFKPLAFTKTFALIASIIIALTVLPPMAYTFFKKPRIPEKRTRHILLAIITILSVGILLAGNWEPLGPESGMFRNILFVALLVGTLLAFFKLFHKLYPYLLAWCLNHKRMFLTLPLCIILLGGLSWAGTNRLFGRLPASLKRTGIWQQLTRTFPGLGKEFMPPLDEGSFLYMPTTMTHASIGEALDILSRQDIAFQAIPEIETVVGKLGRAETPLDPAPISMIETVINYKPEYKTDVTGKRLRFRYDRKQKQFIRDADGELIQDPAGRPFRQWRDHIQSPDDIWQEILKAGKVTGTTSAPKLQPIAARIVMLQSGMRAPMGIKVKGPSLESIETTALHIEKFIKQVPGVEPATVIADRIVGKPYLEIIPDRTALARYGIPIQTFQDTIEIAIGGKQVTTVIKGRERFPVRIRYPRELRNSIDAMQKILLSGSDGTQIPLTEVADIRYVRGPQVIKSEDTFLVGYVVFDKKPGYAEVDVVETAQTFLKAKLNSGELSLPRGVSYTFAGSYENQIRAAKTLSLVLPLSLFAIFIIIYFQFRSIPTTLLIFSGIFVAWSGGFILLWMYGQSWFLDISLFGMSMRELFRIAPVNMSVAVWVGFLALFGIATDDGVIQTTYLEQAFKKDPPQNILEIRALTVKAAMRRVRPCLMTSATTILALLPVLTSTGRGSDVMIPMAIPSFGGMLVVLISIFMVPVLYAALQEWRIKRLHTISLPQD